MTTGTVDDEMLAVDGLRVSFETDAGPLGAVEGVSFSVARERALGIVGESGAGKTVTALSVLGLLDDPAARISGRVRFQGAELSALPAAELRAVRGNRVGMVFQDPLAALHPLLPIGRQIVEAIRLHRALDRRRARRRAAELLDMVRMPAADRRLGAYAHELSGGMRQRAMLAIALANQPDLLIADEPTSALDVTVQAEILDLIGELRAELGMAVVLISHDLGVVATLADEVVVMRAGRIVERGPVRSVLSQPSQPYTRRLIDAVPRLESGPPRRRLPAGAGTALEVEGLVKQFPTDSSSRFRRGPEAVRAVDGVTFTLAEGETLGLVGESGCGKTTLCRSILRLIEPDAGSVRLRGRDLVGCSRRELRRLRAEAQMVFQDPVAALNPRRRVGSAVADPLRIHGRASGSDVDRQVDEILARVGLAGGHRNRYPHELSGGERQRACIARALVLRPRLVIADEPVSALDASIQADIVELLRELRDDLGLAYIFVAHDLALVREIADRIAVMHDGRIVELGSADSVCSRPSHPYTRTLLDATPAHPDRLR